MEVKINREIRDYTESMFFGLSMRQFFFSVLAMAVAIGLYFVLRPYFGIETLSWMCILGAAPFALMGFIRYNGMPAEQFLLVFVRSQLLEPRQVTFEPVNLYYEAMKDTIRAHGQEHLKGTEKAAAQADKTEDGKETQADKAEKEKEEVTEEDA